MPGQGRFAGRDWTDDEARLLTEMWNEKIPMRAIAKRLDRTKQAIYRKARRLGFSLATHARKSEPRALSPVDEAIRERMRLGPEPLRAGAIPLPPLPSEIMR